MYLSFYIDSFCKTDIAAHPESVNVLEEVNKDARTPDKLIDGVNNTRKSEHMWLAPILPEQVRDRKLQRPRLPVLQA
jgi:hypothetical protein